MTRLLCAAIAAAGILAGTAAWSAPPFVNLAFPPPGIVAPREDPAAPHQDPELPKHAKACHEAGTVKLEFTIGLDGRVGDVVLASSSGFADIDAESVVTAKSWRYLPATQAGAPIAVRVAVSMEFEPEGHAANFGEACSAAAVRDAAAAILKGEP